jgi:hypothetical protein
MADHDAKAKALAAKIEEKAAEALSLLDRQMSVMQWPAEFRAIMWQAVAEVATRRQIEEERKR